jgi:hypothetical protein
MNTAAANPKTTILGVLTILGTLVHAGIQFYTNQPLDFVTLASGISGGVGLIMAKDGSTHSTTAQTQQATRDAVAQSAGN